MIIFGTLSLMLGIVGIFVPLLPTTPFLLLTATLYLHSSPKLYDRLLSNRYVGRYIRDYREHKVMPLRAKVLALTLMWSTIIYCIFWMLGDKLLIQILLALVAVCVSWHILSLGSTKKERD